LEFSRNIERYLTVVWSYIPQELSKEGIKVRVVSVPCMELFEKQSAEYKASVLPRHVSCSGIR